MPKFLDICESIKFPVSMEKTIWACNCMTFLGLLIDNLNQCVCIPLDKIKKTLDMIQNILDRKSKNSPVQAEVV